MDWTRFCNNLTQELSQSNNWKAILGKSSLRAKNTLI